MDPARIEERLDKTAIANQTVDMSIGGVTFSTMMEVMEFAKLMSLSREAVPPHLRENPGACLAICTRALRFGFDPFTLAEHSFSIPKSQKVKESYIPEGATRPLTREVYVDVATIAFDSYVIRAVIEAHAPIEGRLKYEFKGDGDDMTCIVSAKLRGSGETISLTSPTLGKRKADIGKNDSGKVKGSPLWDTKPKQQLGYDTARDLSRLHFPEVLMGWYDKDEFLEHAPHAPSDGGSNKPSIGSRLKAGRDGQRGFGADNVNNALEHKPGLTLDASAKREPEPVEVTTQGAELSQAPAESQQLELTPTVETEIDAKKKAIETIDNLGDLKVLVANVQRYLKEAKRKDLLPDFLKVASDREKAIVAAEEKRDAA